MGKVEDVSVECGRSFLASVLPYGVYVHADGTETLFDRSYQPIATRTPDRLQIKPTNGFIDFAWQAWFFDDGNPPWSSQESAADSMRRCQQAMFNFMRGAPLNSLFYRTSKVGDGK